MDAAASHRETDIKRQALTQAPLIVETVVTLESFGAISSEWNDLVSRSHAASPFMTWQWLSAWWEVYAEAGDRMLVLTARCGKELMGGLPLVLSNAVCYGFLPVRQLHFLGTGELEWEEVDTEYGDILANPGFEREVSTAFWHCLLAHQNWWDTIQWASVREESCLIRYLLPLADKGAYRAEKVQNGFQYWIDLPKDWNSYLDNCRPSMRRSILYYRRRCAREGEIQRATVTSADRLDYAMDELIKLHTARWRSKGKAGAFVSDRFKRFHRQIMALFLESGWLCLRTLSVSGSCIAVSYNYRYGNTEYNYQNGFDSVSSGHLKPGFVTHSCAIEDAINTGLYRYDFMRGPAGSYKADYGCLIHPMYNLTIYGQIWRGRLCYWLARIKHCTRFFGCGISSLRGQNEH